ncbi:hypothetical protein MRB53_040876 [Persea americana]|nr:hypothetical protein MRB53_040876 [Persea americana]
MIHPVIDEFWVPDPSHGRSSKLAENKGQMSVKEQSMPVPSRDLSQSQEDLIDGVDRRLTELSTREAQVAG